MSPVKVYMVDVLCYKPSPDEVIGFFIVPNPSNRTMALWFTQPLTEMSTRRYFWGEAWPVHKAANLTAICELIV
jgi:hypothetical protein